MVVFPSSYLPGSHWEVVQLMQSHLVSCDANKKYSLFLFPSSSSSWSQCDAMSESAFGGRQSAVGMNEESFLEIC